MKVKELMLIFRIEVRKRYNPYVPPEKPKPKIFSDTRLDRLTIPEKPLRQNRSRL
jgi:hypothetical protein